MGMSREERESIFEVQTALVPKEFTEDNAVNVTGVEVSVQQQALVGLKVHLMARDVLDAEFDVISKLEVTKDNIEKFKELRLKYVKNRTQGIVKWHENESEVSLRYKQFLDAKKKSELAINSAREEILMNGEKTFEREEAEKKEAINNARIERIKPFVEDVTGLDFSAMNDYDFDDYVLGKKTRFEAEKAAAEKVESDRIAADKAEIERQKAIEAENAKLKAEADKAAAALAKERAEAKAKADAIELKVKQDAEKAEKERQIEADKQKAIQDAKDAEIAKERAAREKLEAEAKAKADAELSRIAAEKKASAELAKAPIKNQLSVWVKSFELPKTSVENDTTKEINAKFEAFKKWSLTQINSL